MADPCVQSQRMSTLEVIVAAAVGVIAIGGSMLFGFRLSRSSMAALREQAAAVNATLGELARRLELECVVAASYQHPVVGNVPAFAVVAGERSGFALRVELVSDDHSGNFVITVTPRAQDRWPDIGRVKPKRDGERFPAIAAALGGIADGVEDVRVEASMLRVVVRAGEPTAAELGALVDAVVVLARALGSTRERE
jgi:hypothetical protein